MVGHFLKTGNVGAVVVGADRIARNGDTANKIGTYGIAVLAREHSVPFYVAAPISTIDLSIPSGEQIPIEERSAEEVTHLARNPDIGGRSCRASCVRCHPCAIHRRYHHRAWCSSRPVQKSIRELMRPQVAGDAGD